MQEHTNPEHGTEEQIIGSKNQVPAPDQYLSVFACLSIVAKQIWDQGVGLELPYEDGDSRGRRCFFDGQPGAIGGHKLPDTGNQNCRGVPSGPPTTLHREKA
jgi:hypothetical protein